MVTPLQPHLPNLGKRLVRSLKVYLSDTGIVTALLEIQTRNQLMGHPAYDSLWETLVFSQMRGHFPRIGFSFYRSAQGAELDFILEYAGERIAIECKATLAPVLTRGNHQAIQDVQPGETLIVSPVEKGWLSSRGIRVVNPRELIDVLKTVFI